MLNVSSRACQGWVLGPIPWKHSGCGITNSSMDSNTSKILQHTSSLTPALVTTSHLSFRIYTGPLSHNVSTSNSSYSPIKPKTNQAPPSLIDLLYHYPPFPQPPLTIPKTKHKTRGVPCLLRCCPHPEPTQLTTVTARTCHPANHYYPVLLLMFSYCFNVTHFLSCNLFLTKTASNLVFA